LAFQIVGLVLLFFIFQIGGELAELTIELLVLFLGSGDLAFQFV